MAASKLARSARIVPFPHNEDVLRSIMENAPIGMSLVDANGRIVYANQSYADMFGRPRDECLGLMVGDLVDQPMVAGANEQLAGLIRGEIESYRAERHYRRKNGSRFWGQVSASAVRSGNSGKILYLIVQVVDIDSQKTAAAAIAESENRWNFALESAGQGVWDHDLHNRRVFYSRTWKTMRGMEPDEEVEGSQADWLARVHPDDRERILEQVRRQDSGELKYNEFEYRERHRDGHWIWILSRGKPVELMPDGSVARIIGTDTDITKIKLTESRLADTLANMFDAFVVYDAGERLVICNEQYRRMFSKTAHLRVPGARFRDLLQASIDCGEQGGVAPEHAKRWIEMTCASLRVAGETDIEMGDGRWLHARARPTADGGSLTVISDITTQRLAEQAMAATNQSLAALARIDSLTGLANRRTFDEALDREIRRSARQGGRISLLLVDVDHFKAFNDAYGHPAGDRCLREVALALGRAARRPGDLVARYGGEEFAAILPDASEESAFGIAEAMRAEVRRLAIPQAQAAAGIVTISIGVAGIDHGREKVSREELVRRADAALYTAKAGGRDRVEGRR